MLDKRLQEIARPELSRVVKDRQLAAITSSKAVKMRNRAVLPQVVTLMATSVAIVVLLFTLLTTSDGVSDETIVASDFMLKDIVKGTSLTNERPDRMLDLTSIFYRDKLVSNDRKKLAVYEELFANLKVEPFSWDGLRLNPGTDYLFELADGRSVYLKTFTVIDGGDFYIVNPQTMERYVLDYGGQVVFWDTWEDVFAVEMKDEHWPIVVIVGGILVYIIYRRLKGKPVFEKIENKDQMPTWLSVIFWGAFGIMTTCHELYLGAEHAGFIFAFTTTFVFMYLYVQKRFFAAEISNFEYVQSIVGLNILLSFIYW